MSTQALGQRTASDDLPLVSVIIPTYNRREYVCEAIDSALAQTYPNVETIVVDDGSTDGTPEVLRTYGDRIIHLYKQNEGTAAAARNFAIMHARGDYIALLDSDDLWLPDKLERQMAVMLAHAEIGLVSGHVGVMDATGDIADPGPRHLWQTSDRVQVEDIVLRSPLHASTLVVRRTCINEALPFDPRFRICEDWHLCLHVASQAAIGFEQSVVAYLRTHESMSTSLGVEAPRVAERLAHRLTVVEEMLPRLALDDGDRKELHDRAVAQELSVAALSNCLAEEFGLAEGQVAEMLRFDGARWSDGRELADLARGYVMVEAMRGGYAPAAELMERMFAMLQRAVPGFRQVQRATRGHVHIELAFLAHQRGDRCSAVRHAIQGLWLSPKWGQNRGVWSIMAKALVGAVAVRRLRPLMRRAA
ncbi:MAG: glycosyltransferase family 2 protein [Anaerolineae bacterium]